MVPLIGFQVMEVLTNPGALSLDLELKNSRSLPSESPAPPRTWDNGDILASGMVLVTRNIWWQGVPMRKELCEDPKFLL